MARGKASVQPYELDGIDPAKVLDKPPHLAIITSETRMNGTLPTAEEGSELGEQIVEQLRVAYDELLNEPIPGHLRKLLAELCKAEGNS